MGVTISNFDERSLLDFVTKEFDKRLGQKKLQKDYLVLSDILSMTLPEGYQFNLFHLGNLYCMDCSLFEIGTRTVASRSLICDRLQVCAPVKLKTINSMKWLHSSRLIVLSRCGLQSVAGIRKKMILWRGFHAFFMRISNRSISNNTPRYHSFSQQQSSICTISST